MSNIIRYSGQIFWISKIDPGDPIWSVCVEKKVTLIFDIIRNGLKIDLWGKFLKFLKMTPCDPSGLFDVDSFHFKIWFTNECLK